MTCDYCDRSAKWRVNRYNRLAALHESIYVCGYCARFWRSPKRTNVTVEPLKREAK